jgi:stage IV sporulation protein FB
MLLTGSGIRIGTIFGHEIYIDPMPFVLFGVFVFWGAGDDLSYPVSFMVAALFSILVHELGHAVAIRKLTGQHTAIVLGFGGATISYGTKKAKAQLLISLAGPFAGFLLGAVGYVVAKSYAQFNGPEPWSFYHGGSIWLMALQNLIWVSVLWGFFNLLPAVPLDGGQALRAFFIMLGMKATTSRRVTRYVSIGIAAAIIFLQQQAGLSMILLFIALWIILSCMDEARVEGW